MNSYLKIVLLIVCCIGFYAKGSFFDGDGHSEYDSRVQSFDDISELGHTKHTARLWRITAKAAVLHEQLRKQKEDFAMTYVNQQYIQTMEEQVSNLVSVIKEQRDIAKLFKDQNQKTRDILAKREASLIQARRENSLLQKKLSQESDAKKQAQQVVYNQGAMLLKQLLHSENQMRKEIEMCYDNQIAFDCRYFKMYVESAFAGDKLKTSFFMQKYSPYKWYVLTEHDKKQQRIEMSPKGIDMSQQCLIS